MKYRVVSITNNPEEYPDNDNAEFPELIPHVKDEEDLFVVDETRGWWPAGEFFHMTVLKEFTGEEQV